jgi:hypothetical protein
MQETLFKQWQDLNQISLDWYRDTSEPQTAAINDWMGLQSDPGAWAQFAKSSLESFRSLSDLGESKLSDLWQAQIGKLDLDGVADIDQRAGRHSDERLHGVLQDPGRHHETLHRYHRAVPRSLEAGEGRRGPDRHPGPPLDRRPGQAQEQCVSDSSRRSPMSAAPPLSPVAMTLAIVVAWLILGSAAIGLRTRPQILLRVFFPLSALAGIALVAAGWWRMHEAPTTLVLPLLDRAAEIDAP